MPCLAPCRQHHASGRTSDDVSMGPACAEVDPLAVVEPPLADDLARASDPPAICIPQTDGAFDLNGSVELEQSALAGGATEANDSADVSSNANADLAQPSGGRRNQFVCGVILRSSLMFNN
jgi:hypothetical protein